MRDGDPVAEPGSHKLLARPHLGEHGLAVEIRPSHGEPFGELAERLEARPALQIGGDGTAREEVEDVDLPPTTNRPRQ